MFQSNLDNIGKAGFPVPVWKGELNLFTFFMCTYHIYKFSQLVIYITGFRGLSYLIFISVIIQVNCIIVRLIYHIALKL